MTLLSHDQAAAPLQSPSTGHAKWLGVLVALLALLAFCPILGNEFISLDDGKLVSQNPDFNPPQPANWGHYWTGPTRQEGMLNESFMPVTYVFWGLTSFIARTPDAANPTLQPAVFHAVSLLLHAINAVLVFGVLRKLIGGIWPAFFGSLLFAVHPLQTESVAWVAETSNLLGGAFSLLAMLEFLRFNDLRNLGNRGWKHSSAWIHYAIGTIAFAVALLSKTSTVVVPVLLLVIEVLLRRRNWRTLAGPLGFWAAMCVPIAILTHHWQISDYTVPWSHRPVVAADAVAFYLYKLFVPVGLLPNYGRTPEWLISHQSVAAVTWIMPVALVILCALLWRKARWVGVSGLIGLVALVPMLGLDVFVYQRFSTTADRYVYLAMLAPALALASLIALKPRPMVLAGASVMILALCCLSFRQARFWADSITLFSRVIEVHPDNHQGQEQVAVAYNEQSHQQVASGDTRGARRSIDQARDHFLLAAALNGDDGISYFNAAWCELHLSHFAEAIKDADLALRDPKFPIAPRAYLLKGTIYEKNLGQLDPAEQNYKLALSASEAAHDAMDRDTAITALRGLAIRRSVGQKSAERS